MNSSPIIHLIMGPVLLVIALLAKIFPPKKINNFYGYRTPRSMRSDEAWKEANAYSTNAMIKLASAVILFQFISYLLSDSATSLLLSAVLLVVGLVILIFATERHLKSKGFK